MASEDWLLYSFVSVRVAQLCQACYVTLSERNLESDEAINGNDSTAAEHTVEWNVFILQHYIVPLTLRCQKGETFYPLHWWQ